MSIMHISSAARSLITAKNRMPAFWCCPNTTEIMAISSRQASEKNSPLRLVPSIREKLKYKAWQEGIVVLEVQQHNINSVCSQCGAKIRRKGADFQCENGHRGSRYLNMAQNLGQKCLDSFKENQKNK